VKEPRDLLADTVAPDGCGENLRVLKEQVNAALANAMNAIPSTSAPVSLAQAEALVNAVTQYVNEEWQQQCVNPVAVPLRRIVERSRTGPNSTGLPRPWSRRTVRR